MNRINVLDCTLRDGGYCNNWRFGKKNIVNLVNSIFLSGIEIIECGFLTSRVEFDENVSRFTDLLQLKEYVAGVGNALSVVMINYNEYPIDRIPMCASSPIDGLRVAFHKKDRYKAIEYSKELVKKGYKVFLQPMVSMIYSDEEFRELIELANAINPYAFYIVDSFGTMNKINICHYFSIVDKYMDCKIRIGFHSHNNLQSAFSNAQCFLGMDTNRELIIDSSIYGMGRGAGNLNTELFLNEMNSVRGCTYDIRPILRAMDSVINRFYEEKPWGYSLPNYLSAKYLAHPNYASYLSKKKTLAIEDMDMIFAMIDESKRDEYDEDYITSLYLEYMTLGKNNTLSVDVIKEKCKGKQLLLIGPGRNAIVQKDKIIEYVNSHDVITISINHNYSELDMDFIFVSNKRRFEYLDKCCLERTIITSNISSEDVLASVEYQNLLNDNDNVRDNAVLMAIKFAITELDCTSIILAGIDGYSLDAHSNYENDDMIMEFNADNFQKINNGIKKVLEEYRTIADISFVTDSMFG